MADSIIQAAALPPASPFERINAVSKEELSPTQKIEKLLWTEMLKHSGLEKAFTASGGESASAFSRYIVEAIADDLTRSQPLGLEVQRQGTIPASIGGAYGQS